MGTDTTATQQALTPAEAASVANALVNKDEMERFVAEIDGDQVPLYMWCLDAAMTNARAMVKGLTARMIAERRIGEKWVSPTNEAFTFENERRAEWKGLGSLFYYLNCVGMSLTDIGDAVSGVRVTDLRAAAERLTTDEDGKDIRADALRTIEDARVWTDTTPKLVALDSPYRKGRKAVGS